MELTELKRVQNTGELPEYSGDKLGEWLDKKNSVGGTNLGAVSTGAVGVLDMAGSIGAASKFNRTADDLLRDAGTSQSNIGGVGYTVQNGLDDKQIESEVSAENTANTVGLMGKGASTGAAIGSLAGPVGGLIGGAVGAVGGLIGGLFGGGAKKREMRRQMRLAEYKRINTNSFNQSGALTTVLQNNLAQTEGNQEDQALYGAADGKLPGFVNGFTPNCKLSNGEHVILRDPIGNPIADIPVGHGRDNKDTVKAFIPNNASVITNKYGASEYLEKTGDINGAECLTAMNIQNKKYKNGKLPGFVNGLEAINAIGNLGLGTLSMLDSYNKRNESVKSPNTYAGNPYENMALYGMSQLRDNPYPIMGNILDHAAKVNYAADNAGGLGIGQRTVQRQQNALDVYNSIQTALSDSQLKNNKLRMAYLDAAANMGDKAAARQMQANQWDLDYYSKAHGAREKMADQRRADALTFFQSYLKGVNDIHMFDRQMRNYEEENAIKREDMNRKYGLNPDGTKPISVPFTHTSPLSIYKSNNTTPELSIDDKMAQWEKENPNPFAEMDALVQKKLKRSPKIKASSASVTKPGRLLNPQAMTDAVQRGYVQGKYDIPEILDFLKRNRYFLK